MKMLNIKIDNKQEWRVLVLALLDINNKITAAIITSKIA